VRVRVRVCVRVRECVRLLVTMQLLSVVQEARKTDFVMGERYSMRHVYYNSSTDPDYHGSLHYYEYPAVFAWVLLHDLLGIHPSLHADFELAPLMPEYGSFSLESPGLAISCIHDASGFTLRNLAAHQRVVSVDMRGLENDSCSFYCENGEALLPGQRIVLGSGETVRFLRKRTRSGSVSSSP
jgi:hypothetical protein